MSTLPNALGTVGLDVVSSWMAGLAYLLDLYNTEKMVLDWVRHTFILINSFWVCELWFNMACLANVSTKIAIYIIFA